jgi:hypothetical protein
MEGGSQKYSGEQAKVAVNEVIEAAFALAHFIRQLRRLAWQFEIIDLSAHFSVM